MQTLSRELRSCDLAADAAVHGTGAYGIAGAGAESFRRHFRRAVSDFPDLIPVGVSGFGPGFRHGPAESRGAVGTQGESHSDIIRRRSPYLHVRRNDCRKGFGILGGEATVPCSRAYGIAGACGEALLSELITVILYLVLPGFDVRAGNSADEILRIFRRDGEFNIGVARFKQFDGHHGILLFRKLVARSERRHGQHCGGKPQSRMSGNYRFFHITIQLRIHR